MSLKKKTFKQRIRQNDMKGRHKVSAELRKRMRVGPRRHNRFDHVESGSRALEELVADISQGSAAPTREVALDPRSLTDLLLCPVVQPPSEGGKNNNNNNNKNSGKNTQKGVKMALPDGPLPDDHPLAIPAIKVEEDEFNKANNVASVASKNQYRHHGSPYLFWERVGLHPLLLKALKSMRFTHPTPVQEEVLPSVLVKDANGKETTVIGTSTKKSRRKQRGDAQKDVVIAAETGSGKTLAFALPILHHILTTTLSSESLTIQNNDTHDEKEQDKNEETDEQEEQEESTEKENSSLDSNTDKKKNKKNNKKTDLKKGDEKIEKNSRKRVRDENEMNDKKTTSTTKTNKVPKDRLMQALIVSPTRELALQINEAFLQLTQHTPHVVVGCVVGGMAPEKQQRVLNRHPHVLICTPGRLWELVQKNEGCYLGHSISRRLSFVVLDEADKLLQSGRFEELKNLLERIHCEVLPAGFVQEREEGAETGDFELEAGEWDEEKQKFVPFSKKSKTEGETTEDNDKMEGKDKQRRHKKDDPRPIPMPPNPPDYQRVITFVTSATLSLQTNYERKDMRAKKTVIRTSNADTMMTVLQQLEIKPTNAHVFTISPKADVAAKIQETYLRCPGDSKDLYLYYFLKMYRERAIVFVNAISMLRRLVKLLEVLGIPVAGLHASLQQRQRLKYIDKFRKGEKRVLVATDIASRGLDVEGLKYVIHFQVPRSTDAYIHRCGRTARCGGTGLSLLLVNAQEHVSYTKLMDSLGRSASGIETFSLQPTIVHQLHPHVKMALQIDKLQKEIDKSRAQNNWARRMSNQADIEVDDMIDDEADNENRGREKAIKILKKRLLLLVDKDMGTAGGKGGFRTSAQALGAKQAELKLIQRAEEQVTQKAKKHKDIMAKKEKGGKIKKKK